MQKLQNVSDILIYVKVFLKELPKEKNDYPLELNTDIRCCEPHSGISTAGKIALMRSNGAHKFRGPSC